MENKECKITLADGTMLDKLRINGNNFISDVPVDSSVFDYNCSPVVFSDGNTENTHEHMELIHVIEQPNGEYWIALRDISDKELMGIKMQSDIEYVALMAGVDLGDGSAVMIRGRSAHYFKVLNWYNLGAWNEFRVRNAVKMKWITEAEFAEITGSSYQ